MSVAKKCYRKTNIYNLKPDKVWPNIKFKKINIIKCFIILTIFFLIIFNISYFYVNLNDISNRLKDKISRYQDLLKKQDNYDKLLDLIEPIDQDTANQENEFDLNDVEILKTLYLTDEKQNSNQQNSKKTSQVDFIIENFIKSSELDKNNNSGIAFESILKNFSYHLTYSIFNHTQNKKFLNILNKPDVNKELSDQKVSIKFRATNIYRIDLNCFWTKSLDLYKPFLSEYKHIEDAVLCPEYKYTLKLHGKNSEMTTEIINYMFNKIYKRNIKTYDEIFLSDFPTKQLINGGGWFPNFDAEKYQQKVTHDYIFQLNKENYDCVPKERIAILIPMRNRQENLNNFLIYMHYYLQKQMKSYKIFVIEQINDDKILFNKGRLYNMGFKYIIDNELEWEFNCFILHDIDLLPLNFNLEYSCADMPKHMSIYVKRLSDDSLSPHYRFLTGGVLALRPSHYQIINGYSNEYFGWGGEGMLGLGFSLFFSFFINFFY
jgi:hypothetical protein